MANARSALLSSLVPLPAKGQAGSICTKRCEFINARIGLLMRPPVLKSFVAEERMCCALRCSSVMKFCDEVLCCSSAIILVA